MNPSVISRLPEAKLDPIFEVAARAKAAGPDAINGTVGMILDEKGQTLRFPSVKKAMQDFLDQEEWDLSYGPLNGVGRFQQAIHELLFPDTQVASIATIGGTEAVAFNLRLIKRMYTDMKVILPEPAWVNHQGLCEEAGMQTENVPYISDGKASIEHIVGAAKRELSAVLLQGNCHNPTGLDLTPEQWQELAKVLEKNGSIALLDMAYQRFGGSLEGDMEPLEILSRAGVPTFVAWSASKNHTIYGERVGLAAADIPDSRDKKKVNEQYAAIARRTRSGAPTFGQQIVALTQERHSLEWRKDLNLARIILEQKRRELRTQLPSDYTKSLSGNGMFALLPLTTEEIQQLEREKVFLNPDGRINIAGIPFSRIPELAQKIGKLKRGS